MASGSDGHYQSPGRARKEGRSPPLFLTTPLSVSPSAEPTQKPTNHGAVGSRLSQPVSRNSEGKSQDTLSLRGWPSMPPPRENEDHQVWLPQAPVSKFLLLSLFLCLGFQPLYCLTPHSILNPIPCWASHHLADTDMETFVHVQILQFMDTLLICTRFYHENPHAEDKRASQSCVWF